MSGIEIRVKKLFRGKKNVVISAIDHVVMYGETSQVLKIHEKQ